LQVGTKQPFRLTCYLAKGDTPLWTPPRGMLEWKDKVSSNIKIVQEREIVPSWDDLIFLIVLYCLAYGLGSLISFFWLWLRIIALIIFSLAM
jgi:hypothetical protein